MGYKRKTVEFKNDNNCNKVVAYYRYSSSKQTEQSIERQIQIVEDFCAYKGLEIVAAYKDEEKSGTSTQGRIGLQAMLRDIDNNVYGQIYGIVVYKTDRLTRNSSDFYAIYNGMLQKGIRTISATEGLGNSTNTPSTEILLSGLFANSAQAYSQELGEKVIKGMRLSAEKGNSTGSTPPLGYKWQDKKLVVDEVKAPIIPIIFSMYGEQDKSKKEIADYLNSLGYTDRRDRPFNIKSFENLLKNKKYIGVWEYGQGSERAELNTVDNPFNTPLISVELYNKVQQKLRRNQQLRGEKKAKVRYALSGRIFCDCEIETAGKYNLMVATGGKGGNGAKHTYHYYQCRHCKRAVRKDIIEEVVWARVQELLNQDNEGEPTIGGVNVGIVTLANKVAEQIESTAAIDYELQAMRENLQKRIKEKDNIIQAIKDNGAIAAVLANTLLETDSDTEYKFTDNITLYRVLNKYGGGKGTEKDPYIIDRYDQLIYLSEHEAAGYFKQTANITFPVSAERKPISTPIISLGYENKHYDHFVYDGQNYTIKGLKGEGGLFGRIAASTIMNVRITGARITSGGKNCGVLVNEVTSYLFDDENSSKKFTTGNSTILNCSVSGSTLSADETTEYMGGLVGYGGVIKNCLASSITFKSSKPVTAAGGIVGNACTVKGCLVNSVSADKNVTYAGGIAGIARGVELAESRGKTEKIGGSIIGCGVRTFISSAENNGGIAGMTTSINTMAYIKSCYVANIVLNGKHNGSISGIDGTENYRHSIAYCIVDNTNGYEFIGENARSSTSTMVLNVPADSGLTVDGVLSVLNASGSGYTEWQRSKDKNSGYPFPGGITF